MPAYRVRDGYRHGAQNQYGPGDVIELSEQEAAGFADKLELVQAKAEIKAKPVKQARRKAKGVSDGEHTDD